MRADDVAQADYRGGNYLLDRWPATELPTLAKRLEHVHLTTGQLLYGGSADGPLDFVYFPIDSVTSMLVMMTDGSAVEAGTVGREGMIGAQSAFASARMMERWIAQVPGAAVRIPVGDFRAAFRCSPVLRIMVQRYVQSYMAFLAQSVACNGLHVVLERCARWLLLTQDRAGRSDFALTHEFLAMMLGVRRPGVSVAAGTLAEAGLITYVRGRVSILDRAGLEAAACECYRITTNEFARLFDEPFLPDEANGFFVDSAVEDS